ncbi:FAD-binding oxidoreductase [Brucella sp. NBRC 12950]|uniref:NAD(P)/FAD-dependent oxidoreductase n=1 Tax=Brucella sp. NBRC 12950 TaxID=2994518 RepID=UPI0024A45585|nr:FAD-binding oxidoreductase [Brucella sp. NBRC 12950]GLU27544.1 oxidoreductase [Brucella sp. NBRC 12950]
MLNGHNLKSTRDWDLIVVGGGIVGCSTALYASRLGLRVLIIEHDVPGSRQSGRNLGFVRQQGRDFRELPLAMGARQLWQGLEKDIGRCVGWFCGGNVALAVNDTDIEHQQNWQNRAREYGLDTLLLSPKQIHQKIPLLREGTEIRGAMFTATDGRAEPGRATRAIFEAALEIGVAAIFGSKVTKLEIAAGRIGGVWVDRHLYRSQCVVCCAGTGSGKLLRAVGFDLPQERIRATVCRTVAAPQLSMDPCVSLPLTGIRQDVRGAFVFSVAGGEYDLRLDSWRYLRHYRQTMRSNPDAAKINYLHLLDKMRRIKSPPTIADIVPGSENAAPDRQRVEQAQSELRAFMPEVASLEIEAVWGGIIDTLPDVIPVLGPLPGLEGLLVATGFSGHGFGLGPMVGKVLAELATGRAVSADIRALSPARFQRQAAR